MNYKNLLRLEFLSVPENVGVARVSIAAFTSQLDCTVSQLDDIKGAVSEAVSNSIIHGYKGEPHHIITITAKLWDDTLEITVEDTGTGIPDIKRAMQSGYSTNPERLGLGFSFMRSFMDSVRVESIPGKGTTVTMTKKIFASSLNNHAYES
ncbi:MAG: anti-sigma F factor [Peptococcaceae bacterium]|nr:anti-sigma F factor [Peptococcaceae bacterium]